MALHVTRLGQLCSAAACEGTLLAVATPEHSVLLLSREPTGWQQIGRLGERHEDTISSLHFAPAAPGGDSNSGAGAQPGRPRLVSSSHDRNAYVWTQQQDVQQQQRQQRQQQQRQEAGRWQAELAITRLPKAGLCCAWAPGGRKFAIGSVDQLVSASYLDAERELWAPRLIKKRHGGAVLALAWHPSGAVLATGAADGRLRLLNALMPEVDGRPGIPALGGSRFGEPLAELALPGAWGLAVSCTPGGACLAAASQGGDGAYLTILSGIDLADAAALDAAALVAAADAASADLAATAGGAEGAAALPPPGRLQHLRLPGLPLTCLAFLSDELLVGGGFDCQPQLFARRPDGRWQFVRSLQGVQEAAASKAPREPAAASLSARIKMFEAQAAAASAATGSIKAARPAGQPGGGGDGGGAARQAAAGPHENCITSICPLPPGGGGELRFVSASLEGCLAEWAVDPASPL